MAGPPEDQPGGAPTWPGAPLGEWEPEEFTGKDRKYWRPPQPGNGASGYWVQPPRQPGYWAPPAPPPGYSATGYPPPPGYWVPGGWSPSPLPKAGTGRTGPLPLHPMTLGDILDASFKLLRANFLTVAGIVAVLVIPLELISAIAQRNFLGGQSVISTFTNAANGLQTQTQDTSSIASSISTLVMLILQPFAAGAISKVVAGSYLGEEVGVLEALGWALRRWWVLLLAWFLVHVMEWVSGVALVLPGLLVMALCVAVAPVIVLERLGPIGAIRRSWRLDRPRMWGILGICLVTGIIFSVTAGVVATPLEIGAFAMGLRWGWVLLFAAGVFSSLVSLPLNAIVATLIYFDGRIRNEGFDLQALSYRLNAHTG
jgi:hypothetical protein